MKFRKLVIGLIVLLLMGLMAATSHGQKQEKQDPLDAKHPMETLEQVMKSDSAEFPKVMETQRKLLDSRYNLSPKLDPEAKMSRGKPLAVGSTAKLNQGITEDKLPATPPDDIRSKDIIPYPSLPHPKQTPGGFVFPQIRTSIFPRLIRFDMDFDLPDALLKAAHDQTGKHTLIEHGYF